MPSVETGRAARWGPRDPKETSFAPPRPRPGFESKRSAPRRGIDLGSRSASMECPNSTPQRARICPTGTTTLDRDNRAGRIQSGLSGQRRPERLWPDIHGGLSTDQWPDLPRFVPKMPGYSRASSRARLQGRAHRTVTPISADAAMPGQCLPATALQCIGFACVSGGYDKPSHARRGRQSGAGLGSVRMRADRRSYPKWRSHSSSIPPES